MTYSEYSDLLREYLIAGGDVRVYKSRLNRCLCGVSTLRQCEWCVRALCWDCAVKAGVQYDPVGLILYACPACRESEL